MLIFQSLMKMKFFILSGIMFYFISEYLYQMSIQEIEPDEFLKILIASPPHMIKFQTIIEDSENEIGKKKNKIYPIIEIPEKGVFKCECNK